MIVSFNDSTWSSIYNGIRREFYENRHGMTRKDMEEHLETLNVHVIKDPADGRWQAIELPDGCELTMLMLKFARGE